MSGIRADRMIKRRERISEVLSRLTDPRLKEVERRAQHPAGSDGFKASSRLGPELNVGRTTHTASCLNGETECNCVGFTGETSSTERAALRLVEGRPMSDPQLTACNRIDSAFKEMWRLCEEIDKSWDLIQHIADGRRGRETTTSTCAACLKDVTNVGSDRLRSGYGPDCYNAWLRAGRPDRMTFEHDRRALKLVPDSLEPVPAIETPA